MKFVIELCGNANWTEQFSKGKGLYINELTADRRVASQKRITETRKMGFGRSTNIIERFYIRSSVQRNTRLKKSNKIQQYPDICLLLNYCTCFGRPSRPSSGVHKTVVAASGTDRTVWGASLFVYC